jgi:uncharacterized protein YlxW (UPF0749 family)
MAKPLDAIIKPVSEGQSEKIARMREDMRVSRIEQMKADVRSLHRRVQNLDSKIDDVMEHSHVRRYLAYVEKLKRTRTELETSSSILAADIALYDDDPRA